MEAEYATRKQQLLEGVPAVTEQKTTLLLSTALDISLWYKSA